MDINNLEEMKNTMVQFNSIVKEKGKLLIANELKKLFEHGLIKTLKWTQYTPSWNDGDPCYFRVRDIYYTLNKELLGIELICNLFNNEDYDEDEYENEGVEEFNFSTYYSQEYLKNNESNISDEIKDFIQDLTIFHNLFNSREIEESLESIFGNNKDITFDGIEFTIEDYEY